MITPRTRADNTIEVISSRLSEAGWSVAVTAESSPWARTVSLAATRGIADPKFTVAYRSITEGRPRSTRLEWAGLAWLDGRVRQMESPRAVNAWLNSATELCYWPMRGGRCQLYLGHPGNHRLAPYVT